MSSSPSASSQPPSRVTIREIAVAASVSPMTVSYALRGSSKISEATRERVRKIAESLGYRPDPLLSHLMHHLRAGRAQKHVENIGLLQFASEDYTERLIRGARLRAERLGYNLDIIPVDLQKHDRRALQRIIETRGIRGLLLTPSERARSYGDFLKWDQLSVVAIAATVLEPHFHRVLPAHLANIYLALEKLRALGYKRIGLAMHVDMLLRAAQVYSAALLWDAHSRGEKPIPPFQAEDRGLSGLKQWAIEHSPDVILGTDSQQVTAAIEPQLPETMRGAVGLVSLDYISDKRIAGVDQRAEFVGATGFDLVVSQLQRGECGVPEVPTLTSLEGVWVSGLSVRGKRVRAG